MNSRAETADRTTPLKGQAPSAPLGSRKVITPPNGWQLFNLRELWQFRELLYFLAWRDVKVRYKQTMLGAAWAVLQPALMMVVFTILFSNIAGFSGETPYPLFVFAGLLPWTFFSTAITNAANSVVGSERLITKIYFPRLAIPFAAVLAAVADFLIAFGLLAALMIWYGVAPGLGLLAAPLLFAAILLVATGVGTFLSALNVAYRDFRYVLSFMIQLWLFATPTVYLESSDAGSEWLRNLLLLNPMTGLIGAFRAAVLGGEIAWGQVAFSSACAVAFFLGGCLYFRKVEDGFADII